MKTSHVKLPMSLPCPYCGTALNVSTAMGGSGHFVCAKCKGKIARRKRKLVKRG